MVMKNNVHSVNRDYDLRTKIEHRYFRSMKYLENQWVVSSYLFKPRWTELPAIM
uniref:Uncharacterized protein n=1 Tax=Solanum tuberosum TaxID=4113 RepID=M1C618_SOLTU